MTWRIEVDQHACMGAGLCNGNLPDRFRLENGKAVPVEALVEPDEDVLDAADYCPYRAINITVEATGESLVALD
ncbi:ferredoxin [Streptomyces sp. NPDC020807]|uniref:ferredoxin n=1 Tax=unclassified Streptomyces TaxID=2593676 RepID=UPI0033D1331A